jgi:hypothetical protein
MSDESGWLWLILGLLGIGGLGAAIAYGQIVWSHRRKSRAVRQKRDEATRELYRQGQ